MKNQERIPDLVKMWSKNRFTNTSKYCLQQWPNKSKMKKWVHGNKPNIYSKVTMTYFCRILTLVFV